MCEMWIEFSKNENRRCVVCAIFALDALVVSSDLRMLSVVVDVDCSELFGNLMA